MLFNRLGNSSRARWNEQVHYAQHEFKMQCEKETINLRVVEDMFVGIGEIASMRVMLACLPIFNTLHRIEGKVITIQKYAAIGGKHVDMALPTR